VSIKLSKTEIEVGKLYFEQGKKPKEIAEILGLSINTVYKAISKYRSAFLKDQNSRNNNNNREGNRDDREYVQERTRESTSRVDVKNMTYSKVLSFKISLSINLPYTIPQYIKNSNEFESKDRVLNDDIMKTTTQILELILNKIEEKMNMLINVLESINSTLLKVVDSIGSRLTINEISNNYRHDVSSEVGNVKECDIPSFIKDNVWVDIIRSKFSSSI